jgi:AcrR family transcriptional regulator
MMAGQAQWPGAVRPSDLTATARIRNAALQSFADKGIASTSIRDVAAAAGVSPGLVQHHFGTKAGLRAAVNEHVIAVATEALQDLLQTGTTPEGWAVMGEIVTAFVRANALALRYVARALIEGDPEAARIFDTLVEVAHRNWLDPLAQSGALEPTIDRDWAAIHAVVFNIASVLFESAISRHLPEPFFSPGQLQRWNKATTEMYRRALTRSSARER